MGAIFAAGAHAVVGASAGADGAGGVEVVEAVVDHAIAVVVEAIADLLEGRVGLGVAHHAPTVGRADSNAGLLASTGAGDTGCAQLIEGLVDLSVTVVIQPVADLLTLRARLGVADHAMPGRGAHAHTVTLAGAGADRTGGSEVHEALVDAAIAVVVPVIADLVVRWARLGTADHVGAVFVARAHAGAGAGTDAGGARGVEAGEAVVDDAIAVVVEAIADLGGGGAGLDGADDLGAIFAAGAHAVALAVAHAGDAHRAQGLEAFVHGAVAVVVHPVADLRARLTGLGVTDHMVAGGGAHAYARAPADAGAHRAGPSETGEPIVDVAVAVVVEAVAELGLGIDRRGVADDRATVLRADADPGSLAGSDADPARGADVDVALIDCAVAVVVETIAPLGCGHAPRGIAGGRVAVGGAAQHAGALARAQAHQTGAVSLGEVLVRLAVAVVVEAVAEIGLFSHAGVGAAHDCGLVEAADADAGALTGAHADATGHVQIGKGLVHLPVAVVVEAVAGLRCGLAGLGVARCALLIGRANPNAGSMASALAHGARRRQTRECLVGPTIAVVVEAVAELIVRIAGNRIADQRQAVLGTPPNTCSLAETLTHEAGCVEPLKSLVGFCVTVVVEAVADLFARLAGHRIAFRRRAVCRADLKAVRSAVSHACFARSQEIDEPLVGLAVTVIVDAVTKLGALRAGLFIAAHAVLGVIAGADADAPAAPLAHGAQLTEPLEALIDVAVTVVVEAIATLHLGRTRRL